MREVLDFPERDRFLLVTDESLLEDVLRIGSSMSWIIVECLFPECLFPSSFFNEPERGLGFCRSPLFEDFTGVGGLSVEL